MRFLSLIIIALFFAACGGESTVKNEQKTSGSVSSPDSTISLKFWIDGGKPFYSVAYKNESVISTSALGLVLSDNDTLSACLTYTNEQKSSFNETWEQPWGAQRMVVNNYNELNVTLTDSAKRTFSIVFRVFNDGVGFRYAVPEQAGLSKFIIMDELSEFNVAHNNDAWWIPAYRDNRYEYLYTKTKISEVDTVHTPFTMVTPTGVHISIHEANLTDYASMTIAALGDNKLKCDLVPWSDGTKVKTAAPMKSPWRTIQIAPNAGGLVTSYLILNLNEPNKMQDISWVKPTKYLGLWWGMHINKYTFWEGPNHGASTKNSKMYIDYCKKFGIDHLLIEGWNKGWTPAWYENLLHEFNFTKCTDDFDFKVVSDYARENGINLIGYHETGSNIDNYLAQIDSGMQMYKDAGMHSIKIGQVGSRLMLKEWHHGQYGVNYYQNVLNKAADYQLSVNFHEPIKPTGLCRTYPHLMAGEGARGQEYNAWSEGNPPSHTVIIPFTRLLAGPMDFTPGIFKIKPTRVHTTLAKQLALYLTIYSPIQMLADLPEYYDGHPAFKFLQDVPVDWETTKVIDAAIGEYMTIVRKDRHSQDWYLGSITNEQARDFTIDLSFLEAGKKYRAEIYADAKDAMFDKNPEVYEITQQDVDSTTKLNVKLAPGGGQAIRFVAL
ncbi:MAG: glycoside hydrolase family 97 protein [Prolixibacteraceae bacterium]|nr:glycoside hydrolase family 97 protein [Prolixibacteraceae bacterium]